MLLEKILSALEYLKMRLVQAKAKPNCTSEELKQIMVSFVS